MEIKFEFDTSKDEDDYEYNIFKQSKEMYYVLSELEEYFRVKTKYNDTYNEEQFKIIEDIKTDFFDIVDKYKINLDL